MARAVTFRRTLRNKPALYELYEFKSSNLYRLVWSKVITKFAANFNLFKLLCRIHYALSSGMIRRGSISLAADSTPLCKVKYKFVPSIWLRSRALG